MLPRAAVGVVRHVDWQGLGVGLAWANEVMWQGPFLEQLGLIEAKDWFGMGRGSGVEWAIVWAATSGLPAENEETA